jgi:hypothetical protein
VNIVVVTAVCLALLRVSSAQNAAQVAIDRTKADSPSPVAVVVDWDSLPQNPEPSESKPAIDPQGDQKGKSIFGILPNNKTVEPIDHPGPMSAAQKLNLTVDYMSPFTVMFVAVAAGFDQAIDAKPGYGQGWEGYGKRYGADFATGLSHTFFVTGALPALLHQDPRYFRKAVGSPGSRVAYAVSRVVITRQDSGRNAFNASEVLGSAASSGIAHLYYPDQDQTASGFVIRMGLQIAVESGFNVLREFYPDMVKKVFRRK